LLKKRLRVITEKIKMSGKVKSTAWIILLISIATLGITLHYNSALVEASPDYIGVWPVSYEGHTIGEEFTIDINVSAINLAGFEYKFRWNNTLLELITMKMSMPWTTYFIGSNTTTDLGDGRNQHFIGVASLPVTGWTGNKTICTYTFSVAYKPGLLEPDGYSLLDLNNTKFSDPAAASISHDEYDGEYTIKASVHDVAVISVVTNITQVYIPRTVGINVTVKNNGDFTETFNVTAYNDGTKIGKPKTVAGLASGENRTLTFNWSTSPPQLTGNYTVKAIADTVSGETHTEDNTKVDGWVVVKLSNLSVERVEPSTMVKYGDGKIRIEVEVWNKGTQNETFPLTVYLNTTILETRQVTLTTGLTKTFVFIWNTAGYALGNYIIKAEAGVLTYETQTGDNTLTDGTVSLKTLPENIPRVDVDKPIVTVTPANGTFTVHVWVKNLTVSWDLMGWEFRLWYNTTILDVINVEEGPFLQGFGTTYFPTPKYGPVAFDYAPRDSTFEKEGCILAGCTLISGTTPNGDGIIATITFNSTGTGTSAVILDHSWSPYCAKLINTDASYIPVIPEFPATVIMFTLLIGMLIATILVKKQSKK
jgi:hypothetical protein